MSCGLLSVVLTQHSLSEYGCFFLHLNASNHQAQSFAILIICFVLFKNVISGRTNEIENYFTVFMKSMYFQQFYHLSVT